MIDFNKDQNLFSIRKNGECLGYIETKDGKLVTSGVIGDNTYNNLNNQRNTLINTIMGKIGVSMVEKFEDQLSLNNIMNKVNKKITIRGDEEEEKKAKLTRHGHYCRGKQLPQMLSTWKKHIRANNPPR